MPRTGREKVRWVTLSVPNQLFRYLNLLFIRIACFSGNEYIHSSYCCSERGAFARQLRCISALISLRMTFFVMPA